MSTVTIDTQGSNLIKSMGTIVQTEGKTYYYFPYWLEATADPEVFIVHSLEQPLPTDLSETLLKNRK